MADLAALSWPPRLERRSSGKPLGSREPNPPRPGTPSAPQTRCSLRPRRRDAELETSLGARWGPCVPRSPLPSVSSSAHCCCIRPISSSSNAPPVATVLRDHQLANSSNEIVPLWLLSTCLKSVCAGVSSAEPADPPAADRRSGRAGGGLRPELDSLLATTTFRPAWARDGRCSRTISQPRTSQSRRQGGGERRTSHERRSRVPRRERRRRHAGQAFF